MDSDVLVIIGGIVMGACLLFGLVRFLLKAKKGVK